MSVQYIDNYYLNTSEISLIQSNSSILYSYSAPDQYYLINSTPSMIDNKQSVTFLLPIIINEASWLILQCITLLGLILILAAFGTSLRIREMYVKALLKIFEYATNIKKEKLKICDDLIPVETDNEKERRKHLKKLRRLRHESFILHPDELDIDENENLKNAKNFNQQQQQQAQNQSFFDKFKSKMGFNTSPKLTATSKRNNSITDEPISEKSYNKDEIDDDNDDAISIDKDSQHENKNSDEDKSTTTTTKPRSYSDIKKNFHLGDVIEFVHNGIDTIIDDDVTKRFTTEELTVWNLLTRTNQQYEYVSFRVTVLWLLGFILRYCILFPFRLLLFFFACSYTLLSTYIIGLLPQGRFKRWANRTGMQVLHRILSRVFSAIIRIHNREHRAQPGSICVANHTSPIDVIILSTDNTYALIGQQHGGFTGMMQKAFSRASNHIWFDRSESKDRSLVSKRMREHVKNKDNCPILIFPEGTCINNTSVMMFKKGCFEIGSTIYPVAIKYDSRFGDAFWNSQKHSMLQYLILMMTSWAIVVDVYYLPPMERQEDEDVMTFTNRVKAEIVKKGSFADLNWDGMLKRDTPKLDLMFKQQKEYVNQLKLD